MKNTLFAFAILMGVAPSVQAEVVRVEITRRADVGTSGYEKLVGTIYFAVDPAHPRNAVVADLDKAKKDGQGRVEFSADLYILQPKDAARRNGVALVEVSNRGNKSLLSGFARAAGSRDPTTDSHLGDGFLTGQGYTLVWVGWQFDVTAEDGIKLHAPIAAGTTGIVRADFTPNERVTEAAFVDLVRIHPRGRLRRRHHPDRARRRVRQEGSGRARSVAASGEHGDPRLRDSSQAGPTSSRTA